MNTPEDVSKLTPLSQSMPPEQQLQALAALIDMPGWKLFLEQFEQLREISMHRMMVEKEPHVVFAQREVHKMLKTVCSWPVQQGKAIEQWIADMAKKTLDEK